MVRAPGVATGRSGSIGGVFYIEKDFWPLNTVLYVKDFHENDPRFVYYLLTHFDLLKYAGGAGVPTLNRNSVHDVPIAIPKSICEQRRIVAILDEAFAGLATATFNAEKNLKNTRELFESYLHSVFAKGRRDWAVSQIGDIAEVFDGPHATPKTVESGPVFLGISALKDGVVDLSETRHVTADDFKKWTRRVKPHADDVVFSYETRLGQAAIIPKGLECCLGRRMGLVRCDRSKIEPRFFLYQYLAKPFQDFLRSRTVKGATVDRISIKELPVFELQVASLDEQRQIVAALD
jgi:type I restriction enzyme S subunit